MRIKEVERKGEQLRETGKEVEAEIERAQRSVQNAQQRVRSAQANLASASETDEYSEPKGDVAAAQARLEAAYINLEDKGVYVQSDEEDEDEFISLGITFDDFIALF